MNMQNLMSQVQKMQKDVQKKQSEIESMSFEGKSEWVNIVLKGDRSIESVKITQQNIDPDDIEMLEDMIKIAFKDALSKLDKEYESKLGMYGKQLNGFM